MKKLDKLILRSFIGPFLGALFISLLILVLQFFWKYIDDLVGKGLETIVIIKLTIYISASLVPLCLPIGTLFASLISFSQMSETFQLVAIKSSRISFYRFLRPIIVFSFVIALLAFLFANYIIPIANHKSSNLLYSIIFQKPAFDLKEGIFYDKIPGYVIKVNKKSADKKILYDMMIYELNTYLPYDNIIIAEQGTMALVKDQGKVLFILNNGWYYKEQKNDKGELRLSRIYFKQLEKILDISALTFNESKNENKNYRMLTISELDSAIRTDTLKNGYDPQYIQATLKQYIDVQGVFSDSVNNQKIINAKKDTALLNYVSHNNDIPQHDFESTKNTIFNIREAWNDHRIVKHKYKIEWHRKFTMSFVCILFMMIGASLGSLLKKGGVGISLVLTLPFFVFYFFTSTSFERSAKIGSMDIALAMWMSSILLLPIAVQLLLKALKDKPIIDVNFWFKITMIFIAPFRLFKKNKTQQP